MKKILLALILVTTLMVVVNQRAPSPTNQYIKTACTRYCHNVTCPHFQRNFTNYEHKLPMAEDLRRLYLANIQALKQNSVGLSYKQINLALYVIGFPVITLLLAWGAFRKGKS